MEPPMSVAILPDPVALTKALIACDSVTPARGAVFDVLEAALVPLGFAVERFTAGEAPDGLVENLLAVRGPGGPHVAFAGHLAVVRSEGSRVGTGCVSTGRSRWSPAH